MPTSAGPDIVQDGLVLHLDAADRNSYISGSAIWTDLSSNLTGNLVNGPTYNIENAGSIVFDSVDDYLTGPLSNTSTSGVTVSCFFKATTLASKALVSKNANLLVVTNNRIDWWPDVTIGNTTISTTINTGEWYHVAVTQTGSICNGYKNGSLIFSSNSTNQLKTVYTQQTFIGAYAPPVDGRYFSGSISNVQIYNRVLTDSEILQNYNAIKTRFRL
jgi:hypothetical protein